jgi:serpin B
MALFVLLCFSAPLRAQDVDSVVNANNQFSLELYSKYRSEKGNIFFSPYSISSVSAMAYEGARGQTADEIQGVFHFPKDPALRRESFRKMYAVINKKDKQYKFNVANALWAQEKYPFLPDYRDLIEKYYAGIVKNMDFVNAAEESRITINNWVEEQTNNKVKDLIPGGAISPATRLVLTNAIYFKGKWENPFNKKSTEDKDFKLNPGNSVKVQTMFLPAEKKKKLAYTETDELKVLELPYAGGELSMLILLPKADTLDAIEKSIDAGKIALWRKALSPEEVVVLLPKFKFETKYSMADTLKAMGMTTAFTGEADFSGMTGKKDLYISSVIHQAFIDVNEEGTEAAAATAMMMRETAFQGPNDIKEFIVDHPFIFLILERETGNILFLGKVNDPRK